MPALIPPAIFRAFPRCLAESVTSLIAFVLFRVATFVVEL